MNLIKHFARVNIVGEKLEALPEIYNAKEIEGRSDKKRKSGQVYGRSDGSRKNDRWCCDR
jgi:hypothetical protein